MTKNITQKIALLGVLTALYIVLTAFVRIPIVGNIQLDLGYLAFAVALCEFGPLGTVVGVIGCALESILFSAFGFSISWVVANAIIGLGCGFLFVKTKKFWLRALIIIAFAALGLLVAKTLIECGLYSIPLMVKLPKSAAAFAVDTVVMIAGLTIYTPIKRRCGKSYQ